MNNDNDNDTTRSRPFSHIGTTIQNVFRNINHAFASNPDGGQPSDRDLGDRVPPPLDPLNSVHEAHPTDATSPYSSSVSTNSSISSTSPAESYIPSHSQLDSLYDDDENIMPELRSVTDSSDESDTGIDTSNHEGDPPPLEPITGTRRARVDDDGDAARDRRHPSERAGAPPLGSTAAQNGDTQQLPRPPAGLFGALFGLGPPGVNFLAGQAPPNHAQAGVDPSPTSDNPTTGRAPHGPPILTAGFTLTIPLFGSLPAVDEAWEDPERAKKLIAGLEGVPLGLVKRLERVGGAPGGHAGDANAEGSSSGCAICWDALLDGESDNFSGPQFAAVEMPRPSSSGADTMDAMDVDAPLSPSHSRRCTSISATPSSDEARIISLPCAHVFHASCLSPWFTRAKKATCPTCRFDIDPENLTYTPPPRPAPNRATPGQPDNTVPNPLASSPQTTAGVPFQALATDPHPPIPPVDAATRATARASPATAAVPSDTALPIPQASIPPTGPGFNPFFVMPGIPIFSLPAIQIPLRPTAPPAGNNQGIDVVTIGVDMFVDGVPPEEGDANPPDGSENADNGTGGGNGATDRNNLPQDLQSLIEGLLRATQNIIPQVINAQGPAPAAIPNPLVDGAQRQPQVRPIPIPLPVPPPTGTPHGVPNFPFHPMMFRPTRPMPPRQEGKTWTLPPAPGPSLRQRIEQREREQGLRCSDMSCGVGPSDEEPYPAPSALLVKQVSIHPLPDAGDHESDGHAPVCAHAFHPACLVSTVRVAGWSGDDKTDPLVEVSCPVCRVIGCVTREEWELGESAL